MLVSWRRGVRSSAPDLGPRFGRFEDNRSPEECRRVRTVPPISRVVRDRDVADGPSMRIVAVCAVGEGDPLIGNGSADGRHSKKKGTRQANRHAGGRGLIDK